MAYIKLPPANFNLIATNSTSNYGVYFLKYQSLYVIDNDSIILFLESYIGSTLYLLYAFVYDKSGSYTYYEFRKTIYDYTQEFVVNIIPLGHGRFLISLDSGQQLIQQFSNAKLNNNVPIPIISNITISTPCYGPPSKYFYDINQQILGCAAYDPIGQNGGPIFDAEFLVTPYSLVLVSSGYAGNYYSPTYTDAYDKTKQNFVGTSAYNLPLIQSNSISSNLMYNAQGVYFIARNNIGVHVGGTTDCSQIKVTGSYAYSKNAALNYFKDNGYNEFVVLIDSNIPEINGSYNDFDQNGNLYQRIQVFDQNNNIIDIPTIYGPNHPKGVVITKSNIFMIDGSRQNIYVAEYNFANPFNNVSFSRTQLTNFHRPVSILGKYKA